jgi:uncharacterized protein
VDAARDQPYGFRYALRSGMKLPALVQGRSGHASSIRKAHRGVVILGIVAGVIDMASEAARPRIGALRAINSLLLPAWFIAVGVKLFRIGFKGNAERRSRNEVNRTEDEVTHPNLDIIGKFFEAYGKRDREALAEVVAADAQWMNLGKHPLAGVHRGRDEIVAFFDAMGKIMRESNVTSEKLVVGADGDYVVEAQRIRTARKDGINLDHRACVLWRFRGGKIVEGVHFFSDPDAVDNFFSAVAK